MLKPLELALLSSLLLSGCAHAYLHDPAAQELAESAKQHLIDAQLAEVSQHRTVGEEISKDAGEAVRRMSWSRLDGRLLALVASKNATTSWAEFDHYLAEDLKDAPVDCRTEVEKEKSAQRGYESVAKTFALSGWSSTCTGDHVPVQLSTACKKLDRATSALEVCLAKGGTIARAQAELTALRAARRRAESEVDRLTKDVALAEVDYQNARTASTAGEITDALKGAAERVKKALDAFDAAAAKTDAIDAAIAKAGLPGISASVLVKGIDQRLRLLRKLVSAATEQTESKEERAHVALLLGAVSRVPGLLDKAQNMVDSFLLPPLLFELRSLELARDRAVADQRQHERAIALKEARFDALTDLMRYLWQVQDMRRDASSCKSSIGDELSAGSPNCRQRIATMLIYYGRAWVNGVIPAREAEYELIALTHERAIEQNELNLRAWNELISVPLDQLVAVYSAGIDEDMITSLVLGIINAAGWTTAIVAK